MSLLVFLKFTGGALNGFAISAELYTKEEALKMFQESDEVYVDVDGLNVTLAYVRYGICSGAFEKYQGWFSCEKARGAKEIWLVEP